MEPRIHLVTLGVSDLQRAVRFYRDGLGWHTSMKKHEDVAFFQMGGMVLALWDRNKLAEDANLPPAEPRPFEGFSLAQCVASKAEADAALAAAEAAGGTILKHAEDTFWGGYSGYFTDPDGYPWEVAWNPGWTLTPERTIRLPE